MIHAVKIPNTDDSAATPNIRSKVLVTYRTKTVSTKCVQRPWVLPKLIRIKDKRGLSNVTESK